MSTPKVERIFAFLAEDDKGEGITAIPNPEGGFIALLGADMARAASLRKHAQLVANARGKPVTLAEFTIRRDLEILFPASDECGEAKL